MNKANNRALSTADADAMTVRMLQEIDSSLQVNVDPGNIARAIASHSQNAIAYNEANFQGW